MWKPFRNGIPLPTLASAEGDGGDGGGGGNKAVDDKGGKGGDDKKFTQADLDRIAANVRRETEAKFKDYAELQKKAAEVDGLSKQLQELRDQLELKDKDEKEKEKILAQRAREQSEREIADLKKQLAKLTEERDTAAKNLRAFQISTELSAALMSAGALPSAMKHALRIMQDPEVCEIELDDKGKISSVKYNGVPQKDLATAAAAFLADNAHFKAAKPGGSGTTQPNGGAVTPERIASMSAESLFMEAERNPPQGSGGSDRWDRGQ